MPIEHIFNKLEPNSEKKKYLACFLIATFQYTRYMSGS